MDYQRSKLSSGQSGYTFIELIVVMAVIALIVGLTLGATVPTLRAYRLSSSAGQLQADLAYGSQLASKLNVPVEFRFYRHADENSGRQDSLIRSYQLLKRDPLTGELLPLREVIRLETGIAIHNLEEYSSILSPGFSAPGELDPEIPIGSELSRDYEYVGLQFSPDGSTSLQKDKQWSITVVNDNFATAVELPDNFRTLVINSVTGTVRKY